MSHGRRLFVLPLIVAATLTGCGDDDADTESAATATAIPRLSAEAYKAKMQAFGAQADKDHKALEPAFQATDVQTIKTALVAFGAAETALGKAVAAVEPPADAEDAHDRLAAGLQEFGDQVQATVDGLEAETPKAALKELDAELGNASGPAAVDKALADLAKLGYAEKE